MGKKGEGRGTRVWDEGRRSGTWDDGLGQGTRDDSLGRGTTVPNEGTKYPMMKCKQCNWSRGTRNLCVGTQRDDAKSGVCNVNISDHQMILLTRKKVKLLTQKCSFTGRSYHNYNKDLHNDISVQDQWNNWLSNIHMILEVMCPIESVKIKQIKQPWITPS